ncbi:hypothetical protein [Duganella vulcania]|uniref:Uncharacterized protein n=1 Tax=Duganella vulcania TaxID=2692166 RepID=A0A845GIM0_9BURK|nr:hypothetical protein [Duganella vulcania]MYM92607.1 hypothetical protein [Duganella vulcania]
MALTYRDKLRLVKDIAPGAIWRNIKTGRTATLVERCGMDLVIVHQSGRRTKKQDHYFAANFEPAMQKSDTVEQKADASTIHLSPNEKDWLVKMSTAPRQTIKLIDEPNLRALNGLVRKGMATSVHGTFWTITDLGVQRCTTIY